MDRSSFIQLLVSMNHDQLNSFIKDNGKRKEEETYDCPWYIDMTRCDHYYPSASEDHSQLNSYNQHDTYVR